MRRVIDGGQTAAQSDQQFRYQARQRRNVVAGEVRLGTPHQPVYQFSVTARVVGTTFVGHACMRYHLGPRTTQKVEHGVRHQGCVRSRLNRFDDGNCQYAALLCRLQRFHGFFDLPLLLAGGFIPQTNQTGQHLVERLCSTNFPLCQRCHRLTQRLHETAEPARIDRLECDAAVGDLVQQSACRVLLMAEKSRVCHGQPHQCRLQRRDDLLHWSEQTRVVGHVVHHHGDHFQAQRLVCAVRRQTKLVAHRLRRFGVCARSDASLLQALHHLGQLLRIRDRVQRCRHGSAERGRRVIARLQRAVCNWGRHIGQEALCHTFVGLV